MQIINPPVLGLQYYLIAVARGVNANSVASTVLSWQGGASAANTLPCVARVLGKSGTLSLMIAALRLNSVIIQPISAASSALLGSAADPITFPLGTTTSAAVTPLSGNWDINVTTFNGTSSTVDVEIYGIRLF